MKKWARFLIIAFVFAGGMFGSLVAPMFGITKDTGSGLGIFFGFILSLAIPSLRKSFIQIYDENRQKALDADPPVNGWDYLTHPTQLPMMLSIAWFIGFIGFISSSKMTFTIEQDYAFLFLPITLLFRLSGLIIVMRKEYIGSIGFGIPIFVIVRGNKAIFRGIAIMIILWGMAIFCLLLLIFHWK